MSHRHTSGSLKQTNKKHKTRTGRSKRSIKLTQGGKVEKRGKLSDQTLSLKNQSKLNRQQQVIQSRKNKRYEQLFQKRLGSFSGPPRTVVLLPLTEAADCDKFLQSILTQATNSYKGNDKSLVTHASFANLKSRCMFLQCKSRNVMDCLDLCQIADIILFVSKEGMVVGELIDKVGYELISSLKAFSLPVTFVALQSDSMMEANRHSDNSLILQKFIQRELESDSKVYDNLTSVQLQLLCRNMTSCALRSIHWRNNRSYLLSDHLEILSKSSNDNNNSDYVNNDNNNIRSIIKLSGYLRGRPLWIHSLIHIVGCGTHRISSIQLAHDPAHPNSKFSTYDYSRTIIHADQSKQDSLVMEATPETLMGEQTWPTEEEMATSGAFTSNDGNHRNNITSAEDKQNGKRPISKHLKIPEGMSSYQADWLIDEEGEWQEEEEENEEDENENENEEENQSEDEDDDNDDDNDNISFMEGSIAGSIIRSKPSSSFTKLDKNDKKIIAKLEQEDQEFPDEIDTPIDIPARDRFARYRALQSFRSSPWHPKENLPKEYNRIFQFENFSGTQKRVLEEGILAEKRQFSQDINILKNVKKRNKNSSKSVVSINHAKEYEDMTMDVDSISGEDFQDPDDMMIGSDDNMLENGSISLNPSIFGLDGYIRSGQYISISIEIIGESNLKKIQESFESNGHLCHLFSLLKHENKLSVLHFTIQRTDNYQEPIRSKEELLFQVGYRRYWAKPIYSESNLNCDKHKSDRFLRHGKFSVATVIGPIHYSPSPVMVYKRLENNSLVLVATGSLQSVNPDRIILKKVILTGYPIRVRRKFAVVRHMFYNPEDVLWFKPAELVTKNGLRGHITETVGTHGLYKSQFSGPINQVK